MIEESFRNSEDTQNYEIIKLQKCLNGEVSSGERSRKHNHQGFSDHKKENAKDKHLSYNPYQEVLKSLDNISKELKKKSNKFDHT